MAEARKNHNGFLVIKCSAEEIIGIGGKGICDTCGEFSTMGTYVAVLNRWLCPRCYTEWNQDAEYYPEDARIERKNFNNYCFYFGISNEL